MMSWFSQFQKSFEPEPVNKKGAELVKLSEYRQKLILYLPLSDFLKASQHVSQIFICTVWMSGHSFNHPISEFWVKLNFVYFGIIFGEDGFILIKLLDEVECRIRELDLLLVLVHVKEHVLELFSPMKVSPLLVLVLMFIVELNEFQNPSIFVLLYMLLILLISEHFAFNVQETHYC